MFKLLKFIIYVAVIVTLIFYFREPLSNLKTRLEREYLPCRSAISYSIDSFDINFGLSKADFLSSIRDAEEIWEKPIGKDLFEYKTEGTLKINLIYDTRQATTNKLEQMGIVVQNTKSSYDALKSQYDSTFSSYSKDKITFESRVATFERRKDVYEAEVMMANKQGQVSKTEFKRLNDEKEYLNIEISVIKQLQQNLNDKANEVNALVVALNQVASSLNMNVKQYNQIGSSLHGEFEEGTYEEDGEGTRINIYQFDNRSKLVRVLAHEFGHALGLEHNEDTKAIMYRLNNGINEKLTDSDLLELKKLCQIN